MNLQFSIIELACISFFVGAENCKVFYVLACLIDEEKVDACWRSTGPMHEAKQATK